MNEPARTGKLQPSLLRRGHPLAGAIRQLQVLDALGLPSFADRVAQAGLAPLRAHAIDVLQVNLGKRCNQTCQHCHVDAGPDRREVMPDAVLDACLGFLERADISTLDITGGAPELHPRFCELVTRARGAGRRVIDRCNLTITRLPNYADLPAFLARHRVEIVASLPWYRAEQTDAQRGDGVFADSIAALQDLNALGYGVEGSGLVLHLVTNPVGASLPAGQAALERDWKRELQRLHGIRFNHLYTLTNMPISRYLEFLERSGRLAAYMQKLVDAFNPCAVARVMCRDTLSVGWDGKLYDCDFNQMLELAVPGNILDILDPSALATRPIRTAAHCFGCTAAAGSSCGGATT